MLRAWALSRGTARGKIAIALVLGGIPIISQSWVKPLVSAAWEVIFGQPIHFPDTSPLWGVLLVALGVGFFIWTAPSERRVGTVTHRRVFAVRHQSMEAVTRRLLPSALPPELTGAEIQPFEINQEAFYAGGILMTPDAAARQQLNLATQLRALIDTTPNAEIIYYGKAHVPLVFLAGQTLSTGAPIRLYELDRHDGDWRVINEGEGEGLGFRVERGPIVRDISDAVIRISISYPVQAADVEEVLHRPYRDVHLSIAEPRVDAIRTTRQIEQIARAFRRVLDQLKSEASGTSSIHVFYSGPMSLAFSLGRQISATIHPPVFVYNFTAKTTPKYGWALHVNGDASPGSLIVSAPAVAAGRS
jgi:hypothetical protein